MDDIDIWESEGGYIEKDSSLPPHSQKDKTMKIGLPTLLGVAFIVLKLTHVISWSWLWVLSPFWIGFVWTLFWLGVVVWLKSKGPSNSSFRR